jgi:hypothetical protein
MKSFLLAGAALCSSPVHTSPLPKRRQIPLARWDASQATSEPVQQGAANAVTPSARYVYQYHYGGSPSHPRWEPQGYTAQ